MSAISDCDVLFLFTVSPCLCGQRLFAFLSASFVLFLSASVVIHIERSVCLSCISYNSDSISAYRSVSGQKHTFSFIKKRHGTESPEAPPNDSTQSLSWREMIVPYWGMDILKRESEDRSGQWLGFLSITLEVHRNSLKSLVEKMKLRICRFKYEW
jgi:hypothetical protein